MSLLPHCPDPLWPQVAEGTCTQVLQGASLPPKPGLVCGLCIAGSTTWGAGWEAWEFYHWLAVGLATSA
jgi:hypothetical protein